MYRSCKLRQSGIDLIKERLHLRIEQADEKVLRVLDQLTETLFAEYHSEQTEEEERLAKIAAYEAQLKPMTKEELQARAIASNEAIANGEFSDIKDVLEQMAD